MKIVMLAISIIISFYGVDLAKADSVISAPLSPGQYVVACTDTTTSAGGSLSFPGGGGSINASLGGGHCSLICAPPRTRPTKPERIKSGQSTK